MATIKIGKLASTILKQLEDYGVEAGLQVEKAVQEVAKETAESIREAAPKLTGDYQGSWTYSEGDTKRTRHTMVVHAEKPEYALSHLLEKGHANRGGGRTEASVHIEPAEQEAAKKLVERIEKLL